jgi:dihydrodipicolinate synthase/N-acetylneuraminate lyase
VIPEVSVALLEATRAGNSGRALELHGQVMETESALLIKNPPVTVKKALELLGHGEAHVRPPNYPLDDDEVEQLRNALDTLE